jgi:hypothetical protein
MNSDFLINPPHCVKEISHPKIVSFGVGFQANVEIGALNNLFGSHYVYTGIELDPVKVDFYQNLLNNMKIVAADGSDWGALQKLGIKPNMYDIAIVRHPNFSENADVFKKIFRVIIPRLLKKGGQLIISVYNEVETRFFVTKDNKPTLDPFLFQVQYLLREQKVSDKVDPALPKLGLGSCADKYMFYFENKYNSDPENQSRYAVNLTNDSKVNESVEQTICKLGGSVSITGTAMEAKITAGYMDALVKHLNLDACSLSEQELSKEESLTQLNNLTPAFHWKWSSKQQTFWLQVEEKEVATIKGYLEKHLKYTLNKVQNNTKYVFQVQRL